MINILQSRYRLSLLALISLLVGACAQQPALQALPSGTSTEIRNTYIVQHVEQLLEKQQTLSSPGISLLIRHQGQTVYAGAKGAATIDNKGGSAFTPLTKNSTFYIASVTKPITAIAIMQLVERGQLDLNDPMNKWLPNMPISYQDITINHLLTHRSGLPNSTTIFLLDKVEQFNNVSNQTLLRRYQTEDYLIFQPGTNSRYLNINYLILAEIINKVSGLSYKDYLQENIFSPLGMGATFVHSGALPGTGTMALNHGKDLRPYGITWALVGAMGIYSTVGDLSKLIEGLAKGMLISQQSLQLMTQDQTKNQVDWRSNHYGFGWYVPKYSQGLGQYYHSGSVDGYMSLLYINQTHDYSLVALGNGGDSTGQLISLIGQIVRRAYLLH